MTLASTAQRRIAELASLTPVHRAFHWLHLHQPQIRQWQLDLVRIPAPTFAESARAAWFLDRFHQLGLSNVHLDEAGNALAELEPTAPPDPEIPTRLPRYILVSAHLDTVFPPGTPCHPTETPDSPRIHAPGICDNGAGLSALLALAAALRYAAIDLPILFAANVGEEGEGDLRGIRHLFTHPPYRDRIASAIILEGSGTGTVVTHALGSLRFRLTVTGPGGHSWADAGTPNPILILSQLLTRLAELPLPTTPRTTLNIGHISGGTSINSIPESASALLDLRSTDPAQLTRTESDLREAIALFLSAITSQFSSFSPPQLHVQLVGNRPAASLPHESPLLTTLRAVDRHLNLRTDPRTASTDANLPLSLHIPSFAIGTGGVSGGIHTLAEWYDPTGRETALRRILLTLLDTARNLAPNAP